ncbi:uncharacterized protein LOC112270892 [Brachypodium distachyon]|nr:uncharacterized protein LOC112270892 [Brachypodium distachyon]|eukprot:XP_024315230.1 uncharacterized protein LOC112270892 [Brachypodium distachyon]
MLSPVTSLESIKMATQSSLKDGFHKQLSQHQSFSQSKMATPITTTSTAALSMKLLVDTKAERVLFAEASEEAVDFLLSILTLPVGTGADNEGFVRGIVTYTVMDDLKVTPMSAISSVTLLTSCGVKDLSVLQEKTVQVGYNEGLEILKASLQSKTVLTDVFLANKHPCNA